MRSDFLSRGVGQWVIECRWTGNRQDAKISGKKSEIFHRYGRCVVSDFDLGGGKRNLTGVLGESRLVVALRNCLQR
jgi:hypothetical protein